VFRVGLCSKRVLVRKGTQYPYGVPRVMVVSGPNWQSCIGVQACMCCACRQLASLPACKGAQHKGLRALKLTAFWPPLCACLVLMFDGQMQGTGGRRTSSMAAMFLLEELRSKDMRGLLEYNAALGSEHTATRIGCLGLYLHIQG